VIHKPKGKMGFGDKPPKHSKPQKEWIWKGKEK